MTLLLDTTHFVFLCQKACTGAKNISKEWQTLKIAALSLLSLSAMSTHARSNSRRAAPLQVGSECGGRSCAWHRRGKIPTPQTAFGHGPPVPAVADQHNLWLPEADTPTFSNGRTKLLAPRSRQVRQNVPKVSGGRTEHGGAATRRDALRHVPRRSLRSKPPDCWHKLGRSCPSSPPPAPESGAAALSNYVYSILFPSREAALRAAQRQVSGRPVPAVGPGSPHGRVWALGRGRRAVPPPPRIPSARPPSSPGRARRPAAARPAAGPGAGGRRRPRHGGPAPRQAPAGRGAHLHPARRRLAAGRRRRGGGQQRHAGGGPPGTGNGAAVAAAAAGGRSGPGLGRRGGRGSGRWGREEEAAGAGRAAQGPRGGAGTPERWRGAPGGPWGAAAAPGDASGAPIVGREKSPPWLIVVNYRERRLTGRT